MRMILLIAAALCIAVPGYCQDIAEEPGHGHNLFMGIPVYGDVSQLCSSLEGKGFSVVGRKEQVVHLSGACLGFESVDVFIPFDVPHRAVSGLTALVDAGDTWYEIRTTFSKVCREYTAMLGEPTSSSESFLIDTEDSETRILYAIRLGLCEWQYYWEKDEGIIMISIKSVGKQFKIAVSFVDYTRL